MFVILEVILSMLILTIASIMMTRRSEPTGCIIYFGVIFLVCFVGLLFGPSIVSAG